MRTRRQAPRRSPAAHKPPASRYGRYTASPQGLDHLSQFESLLPTPRRHELTLRTRRVIERSSAMAGALHPHTRAQVRELVRSMNSYYSNLIEGQSTHPVNIERGLRADFSANPDIAQRQRVAIAHIDAERALEQLQLTEVSMSAWSRWIASPSRASVKRSFDLIQLSSATAAWI